MKLRRNNVSADSLIFYETEIKTTNLNLFFWMSTFRITPRLTSACTFDHVNPSKLSLEVFFTQIKIPRGVLNT